jgi:hypothetical protein
MPLPPSPSPPPPPQADVPDDAHDEESLRVHTTADVRRWLRSIRSAWNHASLERPFMCGQVLDGGNAQRMDQFAYEFIYGQHVKRFDKRRR